MSGSGTDQVARPRRALRIGITGPIGCGKSTVAAWLAARGAYVIDADAEAREVTAPGHEAHDRIIERWGSAVTAPDGSLDRAALARIVFADPEQLAALEAIVHPAVRLRIVTRMGQADHAGVPVIVVEAIKLVEGGLAASCDEVWLVTCPPAIQRERLLARGMAPEDADRRLAAQAGLAARLAPHATRTLDTSGPPEETAATARAMLRAALGLESA